MVFVWRLYEARSAVATLAEDVDRMQPIQKEVSSHRPLPSTRVSRNSNSPVAAFSSSYLIVGDFVLLMMVILSTGNEPSFGDVEYPLKLVSPIFPFSNTTECHSSGVVYDL